MKRKYSKQDYTRETDIVKMEGRANRAAAVSLAKIGVLFISIEMYVPTKVLAIFNVQGVENLALRITVR